MVHRYVKPTKCTNGPRILISLTAEYSMNLELHTHDECRYSAVAVWAMVHTRNGTKWTGDTEAKRYHPDDWWEYVEGLSSAYRGLYIVCDNAADVLTTTGFWRHVDRGTFAIRVDNCRHCGSASCECMSAGRFLGQLVLGEPPTIVQVRSKHGTITICSLRNFTEGTWQQIAMSSRDDTDGSGGEVIPETVDVSCPAWKCETVSKHMRQLISGWIERKCGVWKNTVAQLSVAYWKGSYYTRKICRHESGPATILEANASYGGRNAVWFYGDIGDRATIRDGSEAIPAHTKYPTWNDAIHRCDVTSQYPALLATHPFPTRLLKIVRDIGPDDISALLKYYGVIANVSIRECFAEIPVRGFREASYRTGNARTTLAGPELRIACDRGVIERCNEAAIYELGYPLQSYARHLLQQREACRDRRDAAGELLVKALATAIGGKFSQRTTRRVPAAGIPSPVGGWGPFQIVRDGGEVLSYFAVAGSVYQEVKEVTSGKLLAAVYCYLTSYGRVQMLQIRESLYPYKPFAQCTDGIWVGDKGLDTLKRGVLSSDRTPGRLRLVSDHRFARFITPVHYYVDGKWTLSGYRHGYAVESSDTVVELRVDNPIRFHPRKPPMHVKRVCVRRSIAVPRVDGSIDESGWHIPASHRG